MLVNDTFHIAVLPGDGIGIEVMRPALEVLRRIEATTPGLKFRFSEAPAGATHYKETGASLPESTVRLCEEADAILLGACGMPSIRYPDGTEIAPQVELRFIFDLYAGLRPARLVPGVPSPIVGAAERGIDLVVIRESTEGLFASRAARRSGCSSSRSVSRRGASRAAAGTSCTASTRRTCSAPSRIFVRSSMKRPRVTAMCAPSTSMSTRCPPRWCGGRGISTCWSPRTCSATSCPISRPG
jgi:isocitrate/isopropylmalate dehydrogenase